MLFRSGENNCLSQWGVFARSHAAPTTSPWTRQLRERWELIKNDLGDIEIFGENLYAVHSIEYQRLETHFYVFAVRYMDKWLAWEEVKFYAALFDFPTVPELKIEPVSGLTPELLKQEIIRMSQEPSVFGSCDPWTKEACTREGVVSRNIEKYPVSGFAQNVFKYVRKGHVKTDEGKEEWLDKLPPYQGGGEMIATVSFEKTTFNELPFKFEAGTPDYIGSTALAEALRYVDRIGIENIAAYEDELLRYATAGLNTIEGMRIFGQADHKGAVLSFLVGNIHHYDMGMLLDRLGIAVRTGHHCAQPLMHALGIEGTVRASFSFYNTKEEIDTFIAGVERVRKMF